MGGRIKGGVFVLFAPSDLYAALTFFSFGSLPRPSIAFFAIVEVIVLSTRAGNSRLSTELEKKLHRVSVPLINLWSSMTLYPSTRPVITSILDHPRD